MERLIRQVQETNKLLSDPETDWKECSSAIEDLATAVECMGSSVSNKDVVRQLLILSVPINVKLGSIRSKLVKDVCENLLRIVKVTGPDFQDMANALLPQLINTSKNSSAAVRQPGSKLLSKMSELVRYDVSLVRKIFLQLTQEKARVLMLEQLEIMFVYWSDSEVQTWDSDVMEMMRQGLEDQNEKVRKTAREVLVRFSSRWSERVDELVEMPSNQSKALIISEHRTSALAGAILTKYPDLASKSDSFSRSRSSFTQSARSSFRKSPRNKRDQSIEIHVATPPPKQKQQQDDPIRESIDTEVTTSTTTRISVGDPEGAEREMSAISRRLFSDSVDGDDDDQQTAAVEAFDGSQMHGFQSKQTPSKAVESLTPDIGDTSSLSPSVPSRTIVGRSASASSAEEPSLRHPGVRKLQESKIPSPLMRSPSLLGKKYLDSPTRSTSSPELRPSLLPRPGSFTLKARESSGLSTPTGSEKLEDKDETNPLSASDVFFSKPIPSSVDTPTPPPPSTENVTLRPRRRGLVHSEPEDSLFQPHAPELLSPKLPVPEELAPSWQSAEPVVSSILSDQDIVLPVREQHYSSCAIENTSDVGHLSEDSGHVESDSERNQRRLDDSTSRSDNDVEDACQTKVATSGDIFPDEWRLDDGPRHKFSFEDEIGDRLSDVDQDQGDLVSGAINESADFETEWHENTTAQPKEHFTEHGDYEEAGEDDKEPSMGMKLEIPRSDALTEFHKVLNEMRRLRYITKNDTASYDVLLAEQQESSSRYALDTADTHEELQNQSPIFEGKLQKKASFLQRLTQADRLARSPLFAPPSESLSEEKSGFAGRLPPLQTFKTDSLQAGAYDKDLDDATSGDDHDEDHELARNIVGDDQPISSTSAMPVFEEIPAAIVEEAQPESFDLVHEPGERDIQRAESSSDSREVVQKEESYHAHEDRAGRFAAAEKLFAAKEVEHVHDYDAKSQPAELEPHMRPHSRERKHYGGLESRRQRYPAPTSLATVLSTAQQHPAAEVSKYDAPNVKAAESMFDAADEEDEEDTPKTDPDYDDAGRAPSPIPSSQGTTVPVTNPAPTNTKPPPTAERERSTPTVKLGWFASCGISVVMFLSAIFCIAGILHAAKKMNESHEYHHDLKARIDKFEASIAESHMKVLKLEKDYAIWSEYVSKLTEEEEANALTQLQAIQTEVQKWQQDMKEDLVQFRQALSVDSIEAAFANLRDNQTKQLEQ